MLVNESDLDKKDKNISNKRRNKTSVTKVESKTEQDKIVKNQTYVLSLFISQSYIVIGEEQLFLILQLLYYTLKTLGNTEKIVSWKSKAFSDQELTTPATMIIVFLHQLTGTKIQNLFNI